MPAHVETPLNFTQPTWYRNDGTARTIRGGAPSLRSVPSYSSSNQSQHPSQSQSAAQSRPQSRASSTVGSVSASSSATSRARGARMHRVGTAEAQAQTQIQAQSQAQAPLPHSVPIATTPTQEPKYKFKPKLTKFNRGDQPAHIRLTPRAAYVQGSGPGLGSVVDGTPRSQGNRLGGDGGAVDLEEHVRMWERANMRGGGGDVVSVPSPLSQSRSQSYSNSNSDSQSNPQPRSTSASSNMIDNPAFIHPLKGPPVDMAEHVRIWEMAHQQQQQKQQARHGVLRSSTNSPSHSNLSSNSKPPQSSGAGGQGQGYHNDLSGPDVDVADQLRRWELMHLEAIRKQQQQNLPNVDSSITQSLSSTTTTASTPGPKTKMTTHGGRSGSEARSRSLHSRRERGHGHGQSASAMGPQDPEERRHTHHHQQQHQQQHARAHSRPAHVGSHSARNRSQVRRPPVRNDEDIGAGESWYRPAPTKTPKAARVKAVRDVEGKVGAEERIEKEGDGEEKRRGWYASVMGVLGRN